MRTHIHKYTHKLSNFRPGKKTLLFIRTGWMSNCFLGQFLLFHIYYFIIFDAESETVWTRSSYKVLRKTAALSWKLCLWAECTFVVKHPWSCRYILATSTHANGPAASEDLSSCDIMCLWFSFHLLAFQEDLGKKLLEKWDLDHCDLGGKMRHFTPMNNLSISWIFIKTY